MRKGELVHEVTVTLVGASLEIAFPAPRSGPANLNEFAAWYQRYSERFPPPRGDVRGIRELPSGGPFNYLVTAPLFGQAEAIKIDAFQMTITLGQGRHESDLLTILKALTDAIEISGAPSGSTYRAVGYIHGRLSSEAANEIFQFDLAGTKVTKLSISGLITVPGWAHQIRFHREPSGSSMDEVFFRMETPFEPADEVSRLREIFTAAGKAAGLDIYTLAAPQ